MIGATSGVVLQGVDPPNEFRVMVEEIEAAGFRHLWLTDSSLHARNCYAYLTLASVYSSRLLLGTAVTNPATRHPAITAAAAATADEISGGRLTLGIGTGDRPLLALGLGPSPLATLEAAVDGIRRLWRGEEVSMRSAGFSLNAAHLRFGVRPDIPIFISASGPKTLEFAGRVGDGAILLVGLFPQALQWAISQVAKGAEAAGRQRPHVAVFAYGAINEDEEAALDSARSIAAWFPQTAPHICSLARLAPEFTDRVRRAYRGGEFQEAAEAARQLPDSFVRKVALSGNRDRVMGQIRAVLDAGADSMHVFPIGAGRMNTVRAFADAWREVTAKRNGTEPPATPKISY